MKFVGSIVNFENKKHNSRRGSIDSLIDAPSHVQIF